MANNPTERQNRLRAEQVRLLKEEEKVRKSISNLSSEERQDIRDITNVIKDQTRDLKFQVQERQELLSIGRSLNRVAQSTFDIENRSLGTAKDINSLLKDEVDTKRKITQLETLKDSILEGTVKKQDALKTSIKEEIDAANKLVVSLQKQSILSKQIANNFGVKTFTLLSNTIKSIPGLSALSTPFEEAAESVRKRKVTELAISQVSRDRDRDTLEKGFEIDRALLKRLGLEQQIKGEGLTAFRQFQKNRKEFNKILDNTPLQQTEGILKTLGVGFKELIPSITKAFGAGIIAAAGKEIVKVNAELVELQKAFATTTSGAADIRNNLAEAAQESGNINITTSALLKTVTALSKQFGFPTLFSNETLVTTTKLTKQVGISAEAAGRLAAATVTTEQNFEEQYLNALGTSFELQRQAGVQLDLRNILEETGKVTGIVRANLGANIPAIAEAVTQAKLFGATLNDVANSSKALLDFESSISAELEAELLLGKNINLEKARQAALNGDLATVAKELTREAGDFEEFTKLNVIQQEALAKSLGMQSDQIADILFQQDIQNKTANELRAAGKEELAQRLEAQTIQEKFNASVQKLKSLLGDVLTAFMPIIDVLGVAFEALAKIIQFVQPAIGLLTGALTGLVVSGGNPIGALVGGALGLISDVDRANDIMIPPAGYGETIIKRGEDTIALNNNDTVVAGTNLGGGSSQTGERTNQLLETLIMQNSKKPEISPVGLYEVQ